MPKKKLVSTSEMLLTSFLMAFFTLILYGLLLLDLQHLLFIMAFLGGMLFLLFYLFVLIGFIVDLGRYLGIITTERFNDWY